MSDPYMEDAEEAQLPWEASSELTQGTAAVGGPVETGAEPGGIDHAEDGDTAEDDGA